MTYILSKQAAGLAKNLKEFKMEEFVKWYGVRTHVIGTSFILQYIEWRNKNGNSK